jgi:hypothetical protein
MHQKWKILRHTQMLKNEAHTELYWIHQLASVMPRNLTAAHIKGKKQELQDSSGLNVS